VVLLFDLEEIGLVTAGPTEGSIVALTRDIGELGNTTGEAKVTVGKEEALREENILKLMEERMGEAKMQQTGNELLCFSARLTNHFFDHDQTNSRSDQLKMQCCIFDF
jgi:hypothetical protein